MNQIESLIFAALNQGDNNEMRGQAEAQIFQLAKSSQTDFFLTLANIIVNEQKQSVARQSAATVFRRFLTIAVPLCPLRTTRMSTSGIA